MKDLDVGFVMEERARLARMIREKTGHFHLTEKSGRKPRWELFEPTRHGERIYESRLCGGLRCWPLDGKVQ